MGLTVVRKSSPRSRRRHSKIALVLAGGAVTGGAFKLGALEALDDFLINRKTTDFDLYVGLSAGAFIAAPLAGGITPAEMLRSLDRRSETFTALGPLDFYNLNLRELAEKPIAFLTDIIRYLPACALHLVDRSPSLATAFGKALAALVRAPSWHTLNEMVAPVVETLLTTPEFPFVLDYLPAGLFDNSPIERSIRCNLERRRIPNDFRALHRERGSELYVVATNLDTAERVVFGHDEDTSLTISEAVQASTALPGFYRPARLRGVDYVDGGVRHTANIDVAIEHGADLIICCNPFRPLRNGIVHRDGCEMSPVGRTQPTADYGMLTVLNQVFRTLLHSRLQLGLRRYQEDPTFHGDIILIEPTEGDLTFFRMTPLNLWKGRLAGHHGYLSVTQSIERHYDTLKQVLQSHGISVRCRNVQQDRGHIHRAPDAEDTGKNPLRKVTRRELRVA